MDVDVRHFAGLVQQSLREISTADATTSLEK